MWTRRLSRRHEGWCGRRGRCDLLNDEEPVWSVRGVCFDNENEKEDGLTKRLYVNRVDR